MVDIDRHVPQTSPLAIERVKFCLDILEKQKFSKGIDWSTSITKRLTIEEMVGALVSAEQKLKEVEEAENYEAYLEEKRRIGDEPTFEDYHKWLEEYGFKTKFNKNSNFKM